MIAKNSFGGVTIAALAGLAMGSLVPAVRAEHGSPGFAGNLGFDEVRLGVRSNLEYRTISRTIEVPPVFKTIERQVWREPVYEERIVAVEIPARFETRLVARYDHWGRPNVQEWVKVEVEPARLVHKSERVLVRPGYFETVYERVLIRPATTRVVYERVPVVEPWWPGNRPLISRARPWTAPGPRVHTPPRRHGSTVDVGFRFNR